MKSWLLLFIMLFGVIGVSFAHQPILNQQIAIDVATPYVIEEPEISKAIFSALGGTPHYYQIVADKEFQFYAGITVPKIDGCNHFTRVSLAILDENLRPIQTLDGEGFQWWEWYEEFGKKWYWIGPEYGHGFKSTRVFSPGTYYIKVYNEGNIGNYTLAVGDIEKFTPLVIFKMIFTLPKINKKFWDEVTCGD